MVVQMQIKTFLIYSLMVTSSFSLSSCSSIKEQLGLDRRAPDEFAVITRAPLEIPGNLNEVNALPLPQRGAPRPQETDPQIAAKQAIGIPVNTNEVVSSGEQSLLSKVGTADPNIRQIVNKEAADAPVNKRPVIKRLLGKAGSDEPAATILVPAEEKERLKQGATTETPSKVD